MTLKIKTFEREMQKHFNQAFSKPSFKFFQEKNKTNLLSPSQKLLKKALLYSFKGKAGRFRPRLCFEATKVLGQPALDILPWAMALEMIHTASLIHDDMPCMDGAKTRRRRKCHHLVFGEDMALLAGTCLFVESFSLLKAPLFDNKRADFLELLISVAGFHGMMSGQAMDLKNKFSNKKEILKTMNLKTGALILACVLGPALLWADSKQYQALKRFAKSLGLAYQLADDFQDLFQDLLQDLPQDISQQKNKPRPTLKKKQLQKEGLSQLKKSEKALQLFGGKAKKLKTLIKEVKGQLK